MKTFMINLEKDRHRWESAEPQLQRAGLDYERIPGILGRGLTSKDLAAHHSRQKASWRLARTLTPAELGCALSHLRTYREILKRGLSHALILEDDVVLPEGMAKLIENVAVVMPAASPVVCLLSPAETGSAKYAIKLAGGYDLRPFRAGYYASSYIVTRAAAVYLLSHLYPVGDVADCWERLKRAGELTILAVSPAPVTQNQLEFGSSTTDDIRASIGTSFTAKLIYRLRRLRNIIFGNLVERRWKKPGNVNASYVSHPIDALDAH